MNSENFNLLDDPRVRQSEITKKFSLRGQTAPRPVYRIPLDLVYYNNKNGRIATLISKWEADNGYKISELDREKYNETPTANTEKSIACKRIQDKVLNSKVMTARASKVTLTNKYQGFEISYIFNLRGQANKTPLPCIVFDVEISIVNWHNLAVGSSSKLTGCVMMLSNIDSEQVLAEQMVLSADKILAGKMYSGVMEKDIRKILRVDRDIAIEVGDGLVSETTKTYQIRFGHIS